MTKKVATVFWKVLLSGVLFAIVSQLVHTIGAFLSMDYYADPAFSSVWSKLMMPTAGPPPASFMYYSLAFAFIGGLLFALVYTVVRTSIPGKKLATRGLIYGLLVFLLAGIPGGLSMYLLINLPTTLIWLWSLEILIVYLLGGMIVAGINK